MKFARALRASMSQAAFEYGTSHFSAIVFDQNKARYQPMQWRVKVWDSE